MLCYNPENHSALKPGKLRVVVRSGGQEKATDFDPAAQQGANQSLFSVGEFDFTAGRPVEVEIVADGASIPAQAMYISLAAVKPH